VRYLQAAERAGDWLLATAQKSPDGWFWPDRPGAADADVGPGLAWGTAGPVMFFVEAFRTTCDDRWLAAARQGVRWMEANMAASAAGWAGCGLFTGIGGWVVVLDELAAAASDDQARDLARRALETVAAQACVAGREVQWHDLTEVLWGTAGIGCLLLALGPDYLGPRALELAAGAGDWLIGQAEQAPAGGIRWSLGPGYKPRRPGYDPRFPNFAHGAAGIGFFLARLAQVTGEQRFLVASLAATQWIMTTVRTDDDTCAAFHHDPGGTDLFTLGWCHGPPGLGWLFRQLELTTGQDSWRTWLRRTARADLISGIPERREPGFWDNVARCCGSAGVAEFFLDLHRLEGQPGDLAFAVTMVDDVVDRAIAEAAGLRWSNYEYRLPEPDLPPETTYFQGASGVGSTLLRLHRQQAGDSWTVRWPHAPAWAAGSER
jgi:lantibiotic modifying enzyme